eukprot:TRINITY_DN906_c0_g1_i2.p1 TRINITY_DN906_c0_g1~~TRINITY_DN906_c0_g1_i2.p1  ORF type:complete len:212 (-),score=5.97 TRINITY_DN906_c0_g1_i2:151-762(-)
MSSFIPSIFRKIYTIILNQIAKTLKFNSRITQLASELITRLKHDWGDFNAAHLRVERDAQDWMKAVGGWGNYIDMYITTMVKAGFNDRSGLYLATGLLTYQDNERYNNITRMLLDFKLAKEITCKEILLDEKVIRGLQPEISAAVDLLVLMESNIFVGLDPSTFSFYINEMRKLNGISEDKSHLVHMQNIGTDSLFQNAALLS